MEPLQQLAADNLRKLAKQFYGLAYRHLFEERNPNSPLLAAYRAWYRKLHGIHNPFDVMEQNEIQASIFIFLFEHNLIFQLTILGRFDLIQILWRDGKLSQKERYLLNSLIEELIRGDRSHAGRPTVKILQTENLQGLMHLMQSSREVLKFDLYCALHEEYQRLTFQYYLEQSRLYEDAINAYTTINQSIINNTSISPSARRAISQIQRDIQQLQAEIKILSDKKLLYPNDKPSVASAVLLIQKARQFKEIEKRQEQLMQMPEIKTQYSHVPSILKMHKEKIKVLEKKHEAIMGQMQRRLAHICKEVILDKKGNIDKVISTLLRYVPHHLNSEQKAIFTTAIQELKQWRKDLVAANTPSKTQEIFAKCAKTLTIVTTITQKIPELAIITKVMRDTTSDFEALAKHKASEQPIVYSDRVQAPPVNIREQLHQIREQHSTAEMLAAVMPEGYVSPSAPETHTEPRPSESPPLREADEFIEIPEDFQEKLQERIGELTIEFYNIKSEEPEEDIVLAIEEAGHIINKLLENSENIAASEATELVVLMKKIVAAYPPIMKFKESLSTFETLAQGFANIQPSPGPH